MDTNYSLRGVVLGGLGLVLLGSAAILCLDSPNPSGGVLLLGGGGFILMLLGVMPGQRRGNTSYKRRRSPDGLDRVLFAWNDSDRFTVRDLLNGGVAIFGRTGSGKTSSSGKAIANALARLPQSGGLILAAKPGEDRAMWEKIFKAAGRSQDLLIFSPESPLRFNFLDYEMAQGGHTRNITKCITVIGETLGSSDTDGRESSDFWDKEQQRMIYNAVEVVKLATGRVSAPDLHRFITGAASSPQQFTSEEWLAGFHNQCLKTAWEKPKTAMEQHDFELAKEYWLNEFVFMADKTRSSIMTGVMGILHTFNTGMVRELVSSSTNVSPDDLFAGKWVLIDMAPSEWGDIGLFVAGGWKYLAQKAVLKRVAHEQSNVATIWADEAQQFVSSFDAHYIAQCRSHRGCMVYLTQSLHAYYAALSGDTGRHQADSLLTNFHTKLLHALGDIESANWASGLVGKSLQTFTGGSVTPSEGIYDDLMGSNRYSGNFSQHYESTLQAASFMHGLRTGGVANGYVCDCFVIRSGEPFSSGENWLATSFDQRMPG
ncbi:type IV secretory system conjugative DNA transfer family protein [Planctomicrobium sp. SH527]|uniref:type IV secretory system conjugative DNA transfer family protein n=1 Tax=Planctomicrobium sp. SH527 TaxID=3448123 RepID=UPI003F5B3E94